MTKGLFILLFLFHTSIQAEIFFQDIPYSLQGQVKKTVLSSEDLSSIDKAIKKLLKSKKLINVEVWKKGEDLLFVGLKEMDMEKLFIKGVRKIPKKDLREHLKGIKRTKKSILSATKNFYVSRGFYKTKIKFFKKGQKRILDIKEGKESQITSFEIQGDIPSSHKKTLRNSIGKFLRDPATKGVLEKIQKELKEVFFKKGMFRAKIKKQSVRKKKEDISVLFEVEKTDIYKINAYGNRVLKEKEIEEILIPEIQVNSSTSRLNQRILEKYLEMGFLSPQVKIKKEKNKGENKISVHITEGSRPRIQKIKILGQISRKEDYYADFIKKNSTNLISDGFYNKEEIKKGYTNLITHLRNEGFLRAKIRSDRIEISSSKKYLTVFVYITEGPPTKVRNVVLKNRKHFKEEELLKVLKIKKGKPLSLYKLTKGLNELRSFYFSKGFLNMDIRNKENVVKYNKDKTLTTIFLDLSEGNQVKVQNIEIRGLEKTKSYLVLKSLDFKKGDILTLDKVRVSEENLLKLGVFSWVEIDVDEKNQKGTTALISLREQEPGLFKSGVGFLTEEDIGNDLTLHGFMGVSYNNIKGTARGVSGQGELRSNIAKSGYIQYRFTGSYLEPFLFGSHYNGRIYFTEETREMEFSPQDKDILIHFQRELKFLVEKQLSPFWTFTWNVWSLAASKDYQTSGLSISDDSIGVVGGFLKYDSRDNLFTPSQGSTFFLEGKYSAPFLGSSPTVKFYKFNMSFTKYTPFRKFVFANNIQAGFLKNLSSIESSGVPYSENFFLHGIDKIRGFGGRNEEEHLPKGSQFNQGEVLHTESYFYLLKSEVRFPLFKTKKWMGSLFYDGGSVVIQDPDKRERFLRNFRSSYGLGVQYQTPIGPIIVQVAQKIDPLPGEDKYRIHMSFYNL